MVLLTQVESHGKIETRLIGSILISLILLEQETEAKACGIQKEGASWIIEQHTYFQTQTFQG